MGLFGGSKSTSTTHNQTDNTNTQVATGDGDNPYIFTGDGITVDSTDQNLIDKTFGVINTAIEKLGSASSDILDISREMSGSSFELAEKSKTNEQLTWLYDMGKIVVPAIGVVLVVYFYTKMKGK